MGSENLLWTPVSEKPIADHRIFSAVETERRSADGRSAHFIVLDAPDWAIVVPTLTEGGREYFLMVRQYRHGSETLSLEFPGGVVERGEDPAEAALRELREETGYTAATIRLASSMSPNPAFMRNSLHVFIAEGLAFEGDQRLDENERIAVEKVGVGDVVAGFGRQPYGHALMATALFFWLRERG